MIKISTSPKLYRLDGGPLQSLGNDLTVGTAISGILAAKRSKDPVRAYNLAKKFYDQEEVELSVSDFTFVRKEIDNDEGWNNTTIGQLFIHLDEAKNGNTTDSE